GGDRLEGDPAARLRGRPAGEVGHAAATVPSRRHIRAGSAPHLLAGQDGVTSAPASGGFRRPSGCADPPGRARSSPPPRERRARKESGTPSRGVAPPCPPGTGSSGRGRVRVGGTRGRSPRAARARSPGGGRARRVCPREAV